MNTYITPLHFGYYFKGDDSLPFSIASASDRIDILGVSRKDILREALSDKTVINGNISPGVDICGPVYIGHGATIHPGVEISGPVYIGDNCDVRHGAQIRGGTILGSECVVGHSAEIKNSVCMKGAKMQSGVFIGDSVLGLGARIGSGTILANRRFSQDVVVAGGGDSKISTNTEFFGAVVGDYARLGANVVSAPGTLVGPYTWVSSLVSLFGQIPRAKLVLLRQELEIRDKEEAPLRSGRGEYEPG